MGDGGWRISQGSCYVGLGSFIVGSGRVEKRKGKTAHIDGSDDRLRYPSNITILGISYIDTI